MTSNEKPSPQAAATWWYSPSASEPPTDLAGWLERIRAHVTWARGAMNPREMPSACASLEKKSGSRPRAARQGAGEPRSWRDAA
jgi:hypothetical protein